jgi:hypothetical protein
MKRTTMLMTNLWDLLCLLCSFSKRQWSSRERKTKTWYRKLFGWRIDFWKDEKSEHSTEAGIKATRSGVYKTVLPMTSVRSRLAYRYCTHETHTYTGVRHYFFNGTCADRLLVPVQLYKYPLWY